MGRVISGSGTVALGFGDELPELVDLLFAELDLEAVLARDLLLAVIADRVGIQPPLADPLAAQLAREAVGVSNRLECLAEPLLARDVVLGAHPSVDHLRSRWRARRRGCCRRTRALRCAGSRSPATARRPRGRRRRSRHAA